MLCPYSDCEWGHFFSIDLEKCENYPKQSRQLRFGKLAVSLVSWYLLGNAE